MNNVAAKLDEAIKLICPIIGVSVGRRSDKSTWSIEFSPEATEDQKKAASEVLAAFDPDAAVDNAPDPAITMTQLRAALMALNNGLTPEIVDAALAVAKVS